MKKFINSTGKSPMLRARERKFLQYINMIKPKPELVRSITVNTMPMIDDRCMHSEFGRKFLSNPNVEAIIRLQEKLQDLCEETESETVDFIIQAEFLKKAKIQSLVIMIIQISGKRPLKSRECYSLVINLSQHSPIIDCLKEYLDYGLKMGAINLFSKFLIHWKEDKNICFKIRYNLPKFGMLPEIFEVMRKDSLDEFLDILAYNNGILEEKCQSPPEIAEKLGFEELSLFEYATYISSMRCFKQLLLLNAPINAERISSIAVASGNIEAIRLLEQREIFLNQNHVKIAIEWHSREIFDWLVEKYPEELEKSNYLCKKENFFHGIMLIDETDIDIMKQSIQIGNLRLIKCILDCEGFEHWIKYIYISSKSNR